MQESERARREEEREGGQGLDDILIGFIGLLEISRAAIREHGDYAETSVSVHLREVGDERGRRDGHDPPRVHRDGMEPPLRPPRASASFLALPQRPSRLRRRRHLRLSAHGRQARVDGEERLPVGAVDPRHVLQRFPVRHPVLAEEHADRDHPLVPRAPVHLQLQHQRRCPLRHRHPRHVDLRRVARAGARGSDGQGLERGERGHEAGDNRPG
eukprot:755091-Hanusia_phi.AAC.4